MEAKELMIGDWLEITYHLTNGRTATLIDKIHSIDTVIEGITEVKPIPLTEEILKANGFEKKINDYGHDFILINKYGYQGNFSMYETFDGYGSNVVGYGFKVNDRICFITYIHELQHALRLCGLADLADNFKIN